MAEVKLRGLVLREVDFSDFDRYLTVLTEAGRKIEVLYRNARRGRKQDPAARQLCFSELVLRERGGKFSLREASLVHSFFGLTGEIEAYALACYLTEVSGALSGPDEDSPALCRLLLGALYALAEKKRDGALVKAAFEWRAMAESGYAPSLSVCGVCGRTIDRPPVCFSVRAGTASDARCARRVGGYVRMQEGTLRAAAHVLTGEASRIYAFSLSGEAREQFCRMAEEYVQYHLGRSFGSLAFYRQVLPSKERAGKA